MAQNKIKEQLSEKCHDYLNIRLDRLLAEVKGLKVSSFEETKSSAGDKFETGRAMIQQEMDKLDRQISELKNQKANLDYLDILEIRDSVQNGSLVYTNQGNFLIAIAAGKFEIDDVSFYAISPESPIAMSMKGKVAGETLKFLNKEYVIESLS